MADQESPGQEFRRHQEELAKNLLQSAMPRIHETIRRALGPQISTSTISGTLTKSMLGAPRNITEGMIPKLEFRALQLD